ncbi:MAG: NADPH-dependent 7-cyano-7-deazaguanine reductase QueF [Azoarcus sp.]|jgi:7-cyano-7-deazaguanine reductase|nr:NADPH-dependent 7-cyano-7-deazaguanine reductase QueF [Azoarcus sp.]
MNTSAPLDAKNSPLGKQVAVQQSYAPALLYAIARNRSELGISNDALPFVGEDVWNAYELSWLNLHGKPVVALARFRVPASSANLIESKSLKLYLNSFNQERMPSTEVVRRTIAADLSTAAGETVAVDILPLSRRPERCFAQPEGFCLDDLEIDISTYRPSPELLCVKDERVTETLYSHLLKSNCPVTGQPDWGMLAVRYTGPAIDRAGLLRYIVSFRQHSGFHEQCVERIFCDILNRCGPASLAVWARYTRRGGLDINPYRATPDGAISADALGSEIRQ